MRQAFSVNRYRPLDALDGDSSRNPVGWQGMPCQQSQMDGLQVLGLESGRSFLLRQLRTQPLRIHRMTWVSMRNSHG